MTEYSISPAGKIFGYLFAAGCIVGGIYVIYLATHGVSQQTNTPLLILGVLAIPNGIFVYLSVKRLSVIVDDRMLAVQTTFRNDEILLSEIDGYRRGDKGTFLLLRKDGGKSVSIPQNIRGRNELIFWIECHYQDVEALQLEAETEVVLDDERFGNTREEREVTLGKAQTIGRLATYIGFGLMFWMFVYPRPFGLVTWLTLAAPWVAVYLTWSYKGLLRLDTSKKTPYPTATVLMIGPALGMGVRTFFYDLYDFPAMAWLLLIGLTLASTMITIRGVRAALAMVPNKNLTIGVIVVFAAIYSYSGLIITNCYYDRSPVEIIPVQITGKHISHGKSDSYYLDLAPWGKHAGGTRETVGESFYKSVAPQDTVRIFLNKGEWGVPWYHVFGDARN